MGVVVLPGVVVAGQISGSKTEQIVEGHNVFAVVQSMTNKNITGVTVLVREKVVSGGKLWFNDQYLVSPQQAMASQNGNFTDCAFEPDGSYACNRYPCGGVVVVVPAGRPKPYATDGERGILDPAIDALGRPGGFSNPEIAASAWVEQYFVTDPNDHTFVVDLYRVLTNQNADTTVYNYDVYDKISDFPGGPTAPAQTAYTVPGPIWMVNLLGSPDFIADDGVSNCGAYVDNPPAGAFEPTFVDGQYVCYDGNVEGPDGCLYDGHARNTTYPTPAVADGRVYHNHRRYNAEIVMFIDHVLGMRHMPAIHKDRAVHNRTSTNATNGCDSNTIQRNADGSSAGVESEWRCPGGNDDAEGYSHPFNPYGPQAPGDPGWDDEHRHDTALVDIYYYPTYRPHNPTPAERAAKGWAIYDTEGSAAPFDTRDSP